MNCVKKHLNKMIYCWLILVLACKPGSPDQDEILISIDSKIPHKEKNLIRENLRELAPEKSALVTLHHKEATYIYVSPIDEKSARTLISDFNKKFGLGVLNKTLEREFLYHKRGIREKEMGQRNP